MAKTADIREEKWVHVPRQLTCPDCLTKHSCEKCGGDCQWLHYRPDQKSEHEYTEYVQCPTCYDADLVRDLIANGCPTCKKKHTDHSYCGKKCRWVHHCFDELREQQYTKAQCITCYNVGVRRERQKSRRTRWSQWDDGDEGLEYTACGTDCGYCGQCGY